MCIRDRLSGALGSSRELSGALWSSPGLSGALRSSPGRRRAVLQSSQTGDGSGHSQRAMTANGQAVRRGDEGACGARARG
eukprot:221697-Alexandrium_andersonii.AAC.1